MRGGEEAIHEALDAELWILDVSIDKFVHLGGSGRQADEIKTGATDEGDGLGFG